MLKSLSPIHHAPIRFARGTSVGCVLLFSLLTSLVGADETEKSSPTDGYVLLAVAAALILVGLAILWLVSRRSPRGTVLAASLGIYGLALALARSPDHDVFMLSGAVKLLGVIGGILGLVDLVRERQGEDIGGEPERPIQQPTSNIDSDTAKQPPPDLRQEECVWCGSEISRGEDERCPVCGRPL